jgi:hypothetical protein
LKPKSLGDRQNSRPFQKDRILPTKLSSHAESDRLLVFVKGKPALALGSNRRELVVEKLQMEFG